MVGSAVQRHIPLLIVSLVFFVPLMLAGIFVPSFLHIALAAGLMLVMTVPLLHRRRMDWFSPWNWLFYFTFIDVFLRSIYITFDLPDEFTIGYVLLLGEPKEFLFWPMVVVLLGLSLVTLGYLAGPTIPRQLPFRVFQEDHWSKNRLWFVLLALLSLAWIGFYFFIANTGGSLDIEKMSAYRGLSNDLNEYKAYGYLRWMINLSDLVCYLVATQMLSLRRIRFPEIIIFLLALGTSLFYYFYVQSRSGLIVVVLYLLAITYYLHGKKFPVRAALVVSPLALFMFRWMTILREGSGYTDTNVLDFNLIRALAPMVANNGGIDVSKTAHIMAAIGKQLSFQFGGTLLSIFTIWIPRQLWSAKPPNVDTMVGMAIYGAQTYGSGAVPPGLIAELYWNFWFPGVIVGCFLIGYLLRIISTQFIAYAGNRNIVLLYVVSFMQLGLAFMGSGFASAVMGLLMTSIPLLVVLNFITRRDVTATG